jgi:hypothetical protein
MTPASTDTLVLDHQVITDHGPLKAGQCVAEDGEFVPTNSWIAIQQERGHNARKVADLDSRLSWEVTMTILLVGVLAGYVWGLLEKKRGDKQYKESY